MPSIEQMHPLLHNGQSWMHTRATKPPVPGKTRRPKAHCGKTRFGSIRTGDLQRGLVLTSLPPPMSFKVMLVRVELGTSRRETK
ncbi:hypothetical protein Hanom_Chr02g00175451 [Helianthus anomalus]